MWSVGRLISAGLAAAMLSVGLGSSAGGWTEVYGSSSPANTSVAQHVEFLSDGRIVVAGKFSGDFHGLNSGGDVDGFVMLLNPTGDVVWAEGFETEGQRYLGVLGDDTIITTGYAGAEDTGPSTLWTVSSTGESERINPATMPVPWVVAVGDSSFLVPSSGGLGVWVTKHDSSGAQVGRWDSPADAVFDTQVIADGDGGLVVGYLLPDPGSEFPTAVMVRLDKDLNEVWSTQMPSTRWFDLYNRAGDVIWGKRDVSPESGAPITVSLETGDVLEDGNNGPLTSNDFRWDPPLGRGLCELYTSGSYRYPGPCETTQNAFFLAGSRGEGTPTLLNSSSGEVVAIGTYLPQWNTEPFNSGSVVLAELVDGETVPVPVVVSVVIPEPDENNHLVDVAYDPVTGVAALVGVTDDNGSQQAMVTLVSLGDAVSHGFLDVPPDGWQGNAVKWMRESGVTTGCSATEFCPHQEMTREQQITFLWRYAGEPSPGAPSPFSDVAAGRYYTNPVSWAFNNGITNGVSPTSFGTGRPITRAQAVTFLHRQAGEPVPSGANPFVDVPAGTYYTDPVRWAFETGITTGTSPTTFAPNQAVTRVQFAAFLSRYDNLMD